MKTTKRALFSSVIALILCFSMLVGTTFAWFTDSVESGTNQIVAGNLDVELYNAIGIDENKKVDTKTMLFDGILWEPGVVAYENLTVANLGTLALKYQLSVNFTDASTNAKGETLAKVLKVGFVKGGIQSGTREGALDEVSAWLPLESFVQSGKLLPENYNGDPVIGASQVSDTYGIVIYWQPSDIDNEFNMNNGLTNVMSINLGVKLFATQLAAEEDSFGPDYDIEAAVFTAADAQDLLNQNKDANLVGCADPETVLTIPYGYTGTLTLTNVALAGIQEAEPTMTLAIEEETPVATVKNIVIQGNVVINNPNGSAISGTHLNITGTGNLTAIAGNVNGAFGIGGMATQSINIKGITIDYVSGGHADGVGTDLKYYKDAPEGGAAIGSGYNGAVITLDNVTVTKAIGGSKEAGIGARYHVGVTVNIINDSVIAYVKGGVSAAGIGGSRISSGATENGTTINISGSAVTAVGGAYGAGIGSGYDTHCQAVQPLCTINITGSVINATGGKYAAGVGTGYHHAALAGEIKDSTVTAVSGEKVYKATYTAAMDIGFGVVDPAREGQQTDSKMSYNGEEIALTGAPLVVAPEKLAEEIEDGATIVLVSGEYKLPSLSGKKNVTIIGAADGSTKIQGVNSYHFGENTTIKNVTFTASGDNSVRYATTSGNVVYENCVFEGKQYGYHVDNANDGTITFNKCTFYGRNAFAASGTYSFNGCTFKYTYSNYNTTNIYSEATFNNCKWNSKGSSLLELYIDSGAKAIIDGEETTQRVVFIADARALEAFQREVNFKKNTYAGKIVMLSADIDMKDAYYANWTPIGQTGATQFMGTFDGHGYTIKNLNVDASKQTGANYSSGLFGWLNNATVKNLTIENATVKGNHNVGVIAGYMETSGCTISNCHVINATVVAKHANDDACGDKVGVIVGHAGNAGVKVENCTAKDSTVTAGRDAGQIAGAAKTANVINCTAENVSVVASGECTGANIRNELIGRVL